MDSVKRMAGGLALLFALSAFGILFCQDSGAGERPVVNPYGGYENDGAGLLDAVNRDHGKPAARPPVAVQRPWGLELDPYNPRKYRYDSPGMIDAINRDFPTERRPR